MKPLTSSTSPFRLRRSSRWANVAQIWGWAVLALVGIDVGINSLFAYPRDVKTPPSNLELYFDYGRSTEAKLQRMFGPTPETSAPITGAGWLDQTQFDREPNQVESGKELMVATYGMSFSQLLGFAIARTQDQVTVRNIRAPLAPPNWSYAAFTMDLGNHQADGAVLTIMSQNLPMLNTMTGSTVAFDTPYPYTHPHYELAGEDLDTIAPSLITETDVRQALLDSPEQWQTFRQQLERHDPFYDPLLFRESWLDRSALLRLVRRGYAQVSNQGRRNRVYQAKTGFNPESSQVKILEALVRDFAQAARSQDIVPVIYLVNNIGYQDHLDQLLIPLLEAEGIPYVSSSDFAPTDDPRLFLGDGHFLEEIDEAIAAEVVNVVRQNRQQ
ncbi:MAG: hypothetical protein F6J87_25750 [Spirulina sp. SIO3F2]|nr:hypothetical protein [Spirulina sp. SIO3F2]